MSIKTTADLEGLREAGRITRLTLDALERNGWTLRTRDGSLAAHHEHTLVITRVGHREHRAACLGDSWQRALR